MPGQRNPLTEGKKIVSMQIQGPASVSAGGDTWTFHVARNIRRIKSLIHSPAAALGGGDDYYKALVLLADGQGNTRTVQVFKDTLAGVWAEATGDDLSAINFIATLELAEGV